MAQAKSVCCTLTLLLGMASGDKPTKPIALILIVQLDRMFDKETLKDKEASAFLTRLKSLPEQASKEWADLTKQKPHPATTQLIAMDAAFEEDAFQEKSFKKLCEDLKAKQK